ncbi:hypothetical protein M0811_01518 [Anaeramoeba ignava]|uniref:OCEL domain-containing protein n=1 Tax=Anaeramoeba ignava TaxID=1746090 RepID=A0A9Q0LJE5_ANAIG|nr:hypothetical protein M0811_01518 [Anaeramoeba ignava]
MSKNYIVDEKEPERKQLVFTVRLTLDLLNQLKSIKQEEKQLSIRFCDDEDDSAFIIGNSDYKFKTVAETNPYFCDCFHAQNNYLNFLGNPTHKLQVVNQKVDNTRIKNLTNKSEKERKSHKTTKIDIDQDNSTIPKEKFKKIDPFHKKNYSKKNSNKISTNHTMKTQNPFANTEKKRSPNLLQPQKQNQDELSFPLNNQKKNNYVQKDAPYQRRHPNIKENEKIQIEKSKPNPISLKNGNPPKNHRKSPNFTQNKENISKEIISNTKTVNKIKPFIPNDLENGSNINMKIEKTEPKNHSNTQVSNDIGNKSPQVIQSQEEYENLCVIYEEKYQKYLNIQQKLKENEEQFTQLVSLVEKTVNSQEKSQYEKQIQDLYISKRDEISKMKTEYSQLNQFLLNIKRRAEKYISSIK